jgi:hypothetical protein
LEPLKVGGKVNEREIKRFYFKVKSIKKKNKFNKKAIKKWKFTKC